MVKVMHSVFLAAVRHPRSSSPTKLWHLAGLIPGTAAQRCTSLPVPSAHPSTSTSNFSRRLQAKPLNITFKRAKAPLRLSLAEPSLSHLVIWLLTLQGLGMISVLKAWRKVVRCVTYLYVYTDRTHDSCRLKLTFLPFYCSWRWTTYRSGSYVFLFVSEKKLQVGAGTKRRDETSVLNHWSEPALKSSAVVCATIYSPLLLRTRANCIISLVKRQQTQIVSADTKVEAKAHNCLCTCLTLMS